MNGNRGIVLADLIGLLLLGVAVGSYFLNKESHDFAKENLEVNKQILNKGGDKDENNQRHNLFS